MCVRIVFAMLMYKSDKSYCRLCFSLNKLLILFFPKIALHTLHMKDLTFSSSIGNFEDKIQVSGRQGRYSPLSLTQKITFCAVSLRGSYIH